MVESDKKSECGEIVVQRYEVEWLKLLNTKKKGWKKKLEFKEMISRGIPNNLRPEVWSCFVMMKITESYKKNFTGSSRYINQILADVTRTCDVLNGLEARKSEDLVYILQALADVLPSIGYCQGMGDICLSLLSFFSPEETFRFFLSFLAKEKLHGLFDHSLSMIPKIMEHQKEVLRKTSPRIYYHFEHQRLDLVFCASRWYITLFSRFDKVLRNRIWDHLFVFGFSILPYFVAAIFLYHEKEILGLKNEGLLVKLGSLEKETYDPDILICYMLKARKMARNKKRAKRNEE